ncbi:mid region of cactin-domain-containing protein [Coniochaeta sp. 2T2.1]|nr:mid region of cactin-domain-containing protein [Coniochaeta sp. 2T2.1]
MDPARRAMIEGYKSSGPRERDITSPRRDPNNRISKPQRPTNPRPARLAAENKTTTPANYQSQDDLSRQFVADEDKFVLKQSKRKADIRVREGRAKPIDYLAFNLRFIDAERDPFDDHDDDPTIQVPSPDDIIGNLNEAQLKELDDDIKSYQVLESNTTNKEYWKSLLALSGDRRQKLNPRGPEGRAVNSVASDIDKILEPKTYEQLEALEKQIRAKLRSDEPIDTDYWEELLKSLLVWKAKAKLKKIYQSINDARLQLLRQQNPELAEQAAADAQWAPKSAMAASSSGDKAPAASSVVVKQPSSTALATSSNTAPANTRFAPTATEDFSQSTKALYEREVARGIGENEEIFAAEEADPNAAKPKWADKYRPRKPRYFNRVQMGYEWNKYNQTHYDHDNPPPKVVQGYKFNIFYPDLIDKTKAPTYKIIREHGRRRGETFAPAGEEDTCLIRFIAGPPYEDIAFRIVDREWDYSAKKDRGFKSSFDKGILQLHFQFKKIYYRK